MTARPLLLSAALLAACSPEFDPASRVEKLRVLAVRAEPPEIAPASYGAPPDAARLGALAVHPDFATDPSRRAVVLHVACTPRPGDPGPSPCTLLEALAEPSAILAAVDLDLACASPGLGAAGAVTLAGFESCGLEGCGPVSVLRDPADGASAVELPLPALVPLFPGDPAPLRESYVECDAAGRYVGTATGEWVYSWFATAGEIDDLHTRDGGDPTLFTAPASGRTLVYAVARDLRGGVAWTSGVAEVTP